MTRRGGGTDCARSQRTAFPGTGRGVRGVGLRGTPRPLPRRSTRLGTGMQPEVSVHGVSCPPEERRRALQARRLCSETYTFAGKTTNHDRFPRGSGKPYGAMGERGFPPPAPLPGKPARSGRGRAVQRRCGWKTAFIAQTTYSTNWMACRRNRTGYSTLLTRTVGLTRNGLKVVGILVKNSLLKASRPNAETNSNDGNSL